MLSRICVLSMCQLEREFTYILVHGDPGSFGFQGNWCVDETFGRLFGHCQAQWHLRGAQPRCQFRGVRHPKDPQNKLFVPCLHQRGSPLHGRGACSLSDPAGQSEALSKKPRWPSHWPLLCSFFQVRSRSWKHRSADDLCLSSNFCSRSLPLISLLSILLRSTPGFLWAGRVSSKLCSGCPWRER